MNWLMIVAGSIAGGTSRYLLTGVIQRTSDPYFPTGTLVVNALGCLLAGLIQSLADTRMKISPEARILLLTGFCGAFTTFSAFVLETTALYRAGETSKAILNVGASLVLGFVLFRLGSALGRFF